MKSIKRLILFFVILGIVACEKTDQNQINEQVSSSERGEFYQLKTYVFDTEEQVQTTEKYLKEAFLPGLKKIGIKNIGVFKPRSSEADTVEKILVLVPFSSDSHSFVSNWFIDGLTRVL